jgi:hypothetical protein
MELAEFGTHIFAAQRRGGEVGERLLTYQPDAFCGKNCLRDDGK